MEQNSCSSSSDCSGSGGMGDSSRGLESSWGLGGFGGGTGGLFFGAGAGADSLTV